MAACQSAESTLGRVVGCGLCISRRNGQSIIRCWKQKPPKPLWSSHSSLQTVLIQQLEVWQQKTPNIEQRSHLESVVKAALQSYLESYPTMKETYAKVKQLAVPSILHQFLAPVKLVSAFGENDKELLAFLAARDTDGFNKWEAGQKLFTSRPTH